jgi:cyclophilin family peptidyl-prolyl cis-trans isomerase
VSGLSCLFLFACSSQAKEPKANKSDPVVIFETTKGVIKAEIYKEEAPITATNFIGLVNKHFYDGLTFHRYEPGFCVQGGDPQGNGTGGSGTRIKLEVNPDNPHLRHNEAGVLAMARGGDPNSASSQFYFTLGPAPHLDGGYAVFGRVIDGLDVVKELRKGDSMKKVYLDK